MATIVKLLDGATGTGAGSPFPIDPAMTRNGGSIPIVITGITVATVILQATISTQAEVEEGTAVWATVSQGSWTADIADGLFTPFSHIRGNVLAYTSGTITMKTWL